MVQSANQLGWLHPRIDLTSFKALIWRVFRGFAGSPVTPAGQGPQGTAMAKPPKKTPPPVGTGKPSEGSAPDKNKKKTDHDGPYHRFFKDPRMVAQLLRDSVPAHVLKDYDLDRLERLNTRFHAETGDRRFGDMAWRIPRRHGRGAAYAALILEFQSRDYRFMAVRMLGYAALLWEHLIKEKRLLPNRQLPPIYPLVLYNGRDPWKAPLSLHELIGLGKDSPLWHWQPEARYHIVDQGRIPEADLQSRDTLTALLFRAEQAPDRAKAAAVLSEAVDWFGRHPGFETVWPALSELMTNALGPLNMDLAAMTKDLSKMRSMLAVRAEEWNKQLRQEGRREGRREGRQEGRQEVLVRLLERRFGALPAWAGDRIATGKPADLQEWTLRVLDAESLEEVLR